MVRERKRWLSLPLLWDGFMVYLALINLLWIAFDFTYFWLRPTYLAHVPRVVQHYDRVKGVEPHPFTERYLELVDQTRRAVEDGAAADALEIPLGALRSMSLRMLSEDPLEQAGRGNGLMAIRYWVVVDAGLPPAAAADPREVENAFRRFWSSDPGDLARRLDLFDEKIRPILAPNYFRHYDPDTGKPADHAWLIDLPFLCIFALEFLFRWILEVRRKRIKAWYLFPVFHWYDALGLIPYFRLFRLFRVVSIYLRLHRSDLTSIGQDVISRTVRFVTRAIAEEITDMVTLRILEQTQARISSGVYSQVIRDGITARRDVIRTGLADALSDVATNAELRERAREFLQLNLRQSVESARAVRGIPLPDVVLRRLMLGIGDAVFDSLVQTVADTLQEQRGREALEGIVDRVFDAFLADLGSAEVERVIQAIAMEMLERTKRSVAVKEWLEGEPTREDLSRPAP
jgi:hypothetical protein